MARLIKVAWEIALCVFAIQHHVVATEQSSHFFPYNQHTLMQLKELPKISRNGKVRLLRDHPSLDPLPYFSQPAVPIPNANHIFVAQTPQITWISDTSRVDCDSVMYADKSLKYFMNRYTQLRTQALKFLDQEPLDYRQFDATILEIGEVLRLIETALPPSYSEIDRRARYVFTPSITLRESLVAPDIHPTGTVTVSAIKLGENDWISISTSIAGLINFRSDPTTNDGQIIIERNLSPLDACLQGLELSIEGTIRTSRVVRAIIPDDVGWPRYRLPNRIIRRPVVRGPN